MKKLMLICVLLTTVVAVSQPSPYAIGENGYRVVELEGFEPDTEARVWDLSRLAATGHETALRFDAVSDSVFTATTADTRQTFSLRDGAWLLTRSETPSSVGILSPGVPVRGNAVNNIEMRGRTYQHDHYYGVGSCTLEVLGSGRLIRRDGDTIDNAALDRRTVTLKIVSGPQPLQGLGDRPDSLAVDCRRTTHTWRDADGHALAQAVAEEYTGWKGARAEASATYLVMATDETPATYSRRSHGESSSTPTARLGDHGVTLSGLEHDFADTGVVVADVAGRVYYSGTVDSGGGTVTIRTALPPGEVVITVSQTETTTFKLTR